MRTGKIVEALAAGDGVNANDVAFGDTFPYVALPHSGSSTASKGLSANALSGPTKTGGSAPTGSVSTGFGGTAGNEHALPITIGLVALALVGSGALLRRRNHGNGHVGA